MLSNQRKGGVFNHWRVLHTDDDSDYEVDDSDDRWGSDSDKNEEEENYNEIVVENVDSTVVLIQNINMVNFGASFSRGAGNIPGASLGECVAVQINPFALVCDKIFSLEQ